MYRFSALQRTPAIVWFFCGRFRHEVQMKKKTSECSTPICCFGNQIISIQRTPKVRTYFWNFRKQENVFFQQDVNVITKQMNISFLFDRTVFVSSAQRALHEHSTLENSGFCFEQEKLLKKRLCEFDTENSLKFISHPTM